MNSVGFRVSIIKNETLIVLVYFVLQFTKYRFRDKDVVPSFLGALPLEKKGFNQVNFRRFEWVNISEIAIFTRLFVVAFPTPSLTANSGLLVHCPQDGMCLGRAETKVSPLLKL